MQRYELFLALLLSATFGASCCSAEILFNFVKKSDPCPIKCQKIHIRTVQKDNFVDVQQVTSSDCQRGCRFYNLISFSKKLDQRGVNDTLESCDSSCRAAYPELRSAATCRLGCISMALHREIFENSAVSLMMRLDDERPIPNLLALPVHFAAMQSSSAGNVAATVNPTLGDEPLANWWDTDDYKSTDTTAGQYNVVVKSKTYAPKTDLFESLCVLKHADIYSWLLALAIFAVVLSILWLYLAPEKFKDAQQDDAATLVTAASAPAPPSSKFTVYLPDEAPLHKIPPPKYYDVVDMNDKNIKV
uniref:Transmembrane protein 59 n=1 Tax=Trichogramma kaykai TaxID=54128 RepID=A0ABD2VW59_9HYME